MMPEITDIFSNSRSERRFDPEKGIPLSKVEKVVTEAGKAPSGLNKQPWLYCAVSNKDIRTRITLECESIETEFYNKINTKAKEEFNSMGCRITKSFLSDAPFLICVFSHNSAPYHIKSTWLSISWFILAAKAEGLATLTYTPDRLGFLNEILDISPDYEPQVILPLGYGLTSGKKSRKPVEEIMKIYD